MGNSHLRGIGVKPLAAALALALGAGSVGAQAGTHSLANLKTRMQTLHAAAARARDYLSQHRNDSPFFRKSHPHPTTRQGLHRPPAPTAATATVTSCIDDVNSATTAGTLRHAVLNAVNGDTIDLSACNNSTITLTQGALPVAVDGLTIAGGSGNNVIIDGNAADRVFYVTAPATSGNDYLTLTNLTVRNGAAPMQMVDTTYQALGGCIYAYDESIALAYTTVSGCNATIAGGATGGNAGGGGIAAYGLYMYQSVISGNTVSATTSTPGSAEAIGGGAFVRGKYTTYMRNSSISGNTVTSNGGALAEAGALWAFGPYIYNSRISNNRVEQNAGSANAPYIALAGGVTTKYGGTVSFSTISGNTSQCTTTGTYKYAICLGGGLVNGYLPGANPGTLDISYSTISGNSADVFGGGILSKYGVSLVQSTITGNSAAVGAGVALKYSADGLAAYNSTIARNNAEYVGGGVYLFDYGANTSNVPPPVTLVSTLVANNSGAYGGADIYLQGDYPLTIAGSNDLVMEVSSNITLPAGTLGTDPMLGPLADNGGPTQTIALLAGSPALGAGSNPNEYSNDQRGSGFPRTVGGSTDIGALQGTAAVAAAAVPAPALSTWALGLLAGLLGFFGWRRRSRI
jgi:hypothetical protein